jgi:hypothetical protein
LTKATYDINRILFKNIGLPTEARVMSPWFFHPYGQRYARVCLLDQFLQLVELKVDFAFVKVGGNAVHGFCDVLSDAEPSSPLVQLIGTIFPLILYCFISRLATLAVTLNLSSVACEGFCFEVSGFLS